MFQIQMIRIPVFVIAIGLIMAAGSSCLHGEETERVWTSADGKEKIRAVLTDYDPREKTLTLELDSGETIQLAPKQLSMRDRHHLRAYLNNRENDDVVQNDAVAKDRAKTNQDKASSNPRRLTGPNRERLYGIDWVTNIPAALVYAEGKESAADDRPVMWFRVLGDLSGFM